MKSKKNLLEQLKSLPYFTKNSILQLGVPLGLTASTVDTYISRYLKYKEIISLKKGLYITTDFYENNKSDISYIYYLANIIRTPSYITSWAALQYYNLVTEATYSINLVTLKTTRDYKTKVGSFSYQSINKDFFSHFSLISGRFDFYIASPAKALFDLLYFRTNRFYGLKLNDIRTLIEELRIDFAEMDKIEQDKFYSLINKIII